MSCTTEIRSTETNFKLARHVVEALAAKYSFPTEEGWSVVCSSSVESLAKKFKKNRKQNNPFRDITKQRTSFSLFTKERRSKIAEQNPTANFTDLSKLVSKAWKELSEKEKQVYKDLETKDKERYRVECDALRAKLASQPVVEVVQTTTTEVDTTAAATPVSKNAPSKSKGKKTADATPATSATPVATPAKPATPSASKSASKPKVAKAIPVALRLFSATTPATPVVAEATPVAAVAVAPKAAKTPKPAKVVKA